MPGAYRRPVHSGRPEMKIAGRQSHASAKETTGCTNSDITEVVLYSDRINHYHRNPEPDYNEYEGFIQLAK
jgi:hypothetical protein